jgi:hypothetical protein
VVGVSNYSRLNPGGVEVGNLSREWDLRDRAINNTYHTHAYLVFGEHPGIVAGVEL